ncbi:MAG TPA: 3-hydroxyacyl-CoA dehydrogenase NAD-binding domain-containing protein, partial [Opitutaceae bacterium]|nr:3-hydroxyacyl-CoA dehydrogenase NAD-binding domain-containing protein [Opitutaceae bacterium]
LVDSDGIGWIVFDDPVARANVFTSSVLSALNACIEQARANPVLRALVLWSAKERIFIAGADLKLLQGLPSVEAATLLSREGQGVFRSLDTMHVPVIAAIHGACAGGGTELALAATYRVASTAAYTLIGLPEVGIGTIPGWGGCVRLPRLLGPKAALEHILKAELVPAEVACEIGLVDELLPAEHFKAAVRLVALRLSHFHLPPRPSDFELESDFFRNIRKLTLTRTGGTQPAPLAAIDAVEQAWEQDIDAAFETEARYFGAVTAGAECKNLIHVFFLKDLAKKVSLDPWFRAAPNVKTVSANPIHRVGVVGAGVMGSGIAQWLAMRGFDVILRDVSPELVERGLTVMRELLHNAVQRKKISSEEAYKAQKRVLITTEWDGFDTCDVVIEAIVENVAAKQALFAELESVVRDDALLASNTSALPIEELSARVRHPERMLGIHFFNPVNRMPLVELVLGARTERSAAERALSLVKALGKQAVICKSSPGFLVTRVLFFYLNAAVRLREQGLAVDHIDAALHAFGWPMGPFRLIDEVGVDVTQFIFGEMQHYFSERFEATTLCEQMLAHGFRGRKNGASSGFYTYGDGEKINKAISGLVPVSPTNQMEPDEIRDQLMQMMIAEAQYCLDEGVVRMADDVDFALLTGAGFPAFRGGLMRYAELRQLKG